MDLRSPQKLKLFGDPNINERKEIMKKLVIMTTIFMGFAMVSCNVTRVITNESQYLQKGDTSVVIQTKTIETYEASKK